MKTLSLSINSLLIFLLVGITLEMTLSILSDDIDILSSLYLGIKSFT